MALAELNGGKQVVRQTNPPPDRRCHLLGRSHKAVAGHSLSKSLSPGGHVIPGCFNHGAVAFCHLMGTGASELAQGLLTDGLLEHGQGVTGDIEIVITQFRMPLGGNDVTAGRTSCPGPVLTVGSNLNELIFFQDVKVAADCRRGKTQELTQFGRRNRAMS